MRERLLPLPDSVAESLQQICSLARLREGGESMLKAFVSIQNRLALLRDDQGQTMAEYGVVLAVITVAIVVALTALSGAIGGALNRVTALL
jgi:Flp pilus assembly pilin Flp